MRNIRLSNALAAAFVAALVLSPAAISARTWRVEKDGSGDFAVIQEAVDVAASGDTVRIGVGRFDDKRYFTNPGWSDSVRVIVHQYELTIIGSGPATIIGQEEPWELEQGNHKGIATGQLEGVLENSIIRIRDIRFENMRTGIYASYEDTSGSRVEIVGCEFLAHRRALTLISGDVGGEVVVDDCLFDGMARDGSQVHCWRQDKFTMRGCRSILIYDPPWTRTHFGAWDVTDLLIEDCEFNGGTGAAVFTYGGPAVIRDCRFEGQNGICIAAEPGSDVSVQNCTFENQYRTIQSIRPNNRVAVLNSQFVNVADCSFRLPEVGEFVARDNDIAAGTRGAVLIDYSSTCDAHRTLDFTNNYWYTDNPDSIAAWIHDRNDSDEACYYVDFEPFRTESTPVEQRSLADIKRLFR